MKPVNSSKSSEMSTPDFAADAKRFIEIAGEQSVWRSNVKAAIEAAARRLNIKPRRARALYYQEARVIPVQEYYALKAKTDEILARTSALRGHHEFLRSMAVPNHRVDLDPAGASSAGHPPQVPARDDAPV